MMRWMLLGVFRDKTRSLFPYLVVAVGVTLVIFFLGFMEGVLFGMMDTTAKLDTGYLRVVNKPFYDEEHLNPLDRALAAQREVHEWLKKNSGPGVTWSPRIRWGAIMDVPDEKGETRSQTPVAGFALDLLSPDTPEPDRFKMKDSLVQGRLPAESREMLVGYELAKTLKLELGNTVTLIGQSFEGGLAVDNYKVVGLIRFGVFAMDKKMALIDIADAQESFYMEDMVTDWLAFFSRPLSIPEYQKRKEALASRLEQFRRNPPLTWAPDDFPIVLSVLDQRNVGKIANIFFLVRNIMVGVVMFLMVLVLWNAGLLNGIHRYGEMGLRLAMGETQWGLITSLVLEALIIGALGSLTGAVVGGAIVYYLQEVGINMGDSFAQTGLMLSDVMRGRMTVTAFIYGVVPGLFSNVLGTLIASLAIFQRSEANLFRELEAG